MRLGKIIVLSAALSLSSAAARAQWEVEADPTAYALKGFSVHLGHPIPGERFRVQVGTFGAEIPEWIHGNSGFTENARGATFKFDYFPLQPMSGLFFGADSNYSWVRYELSHTHEHVDRNIVGLGPRVGYRFNIGKHFYLSPWVSADYQFNAKDRSPSRLDVLGMQASALGLAQTGSRRRESSTSGLACPAPARYIAASAR